MKYDIIVLGAGSGGLNIASFMNTLKLKVLLVEKHLVGGDCLNYGCVPSKALISIANTVSHAREAETYGIHTVGRVDMKKIAAVIRERQDMIRVHENPDFFREKGIHVEMQNSFHNLHTATRTIAALRYCVHGEVFADWWSSTKPCCNPPYPQA